MGFLHYDPKPMTEAEAEQWIAEWGLYPDYIKGRVMKIDLTTNEVWTVLYNRDNGLNAAEEVISSLRASQGYP